jgi:hypothetical protein
MKPVATRSRTGGIAGRAWALPLCRVQQRVYIEPVQRLRRHDRGGGCDQSPADDRSRGDQVGANRQASGQGGRRHEPECGSGQRAGHADDRSLGHDAPGRTRMSTLKDAQCRPTTLPPARLAALPGALGIPNAANRSTGLGVPAMTSAPIGLRHAGTSVQSHDRFVGLRKRRSAPWSTAGLRSLLS